MESLNFQNIRKNKNIKKLVIHSTIFKRLQPQIGTAKTIKKLQIGPKNKKNIEKL